MKRRHFLQGLLGVLLLPLQALATAWNKSAFDAQALNVAMEALGITDAAPSLAIDIVAPDKAENGAVVQVEVTSRIPNTEEILLLVAQNPTPLIARFVLQAGMQPRMITRIKMADTSDVQVVVKAGNRYYTHSKQVVVLEDGCGGSASEAAFESSMKMRAKLVNDVTEFKVIIVHPMSTGRAKNDRGVIIPAHFIQVMQMLLNGKPLLEAHLSTAIAKNPYFTFYVANAQLGDQAEVRWQDNQGYTGQGNVTVSVS